MKCAHLLMDTRSSTLECSPSRQAAYLGIKSYMIETKPQLTISTTLIQSHPCSASQKHLPPLTKEKQGVGGGKRKFFCDFDGFIKFSLTVTLNLKRT